ncbi:MAG: hypothetical protein LBI39_00035 [Puniceicoccales bacterium]|nr:hypothetical protein [Puniceicoccales bacterium]
MRKLAARGGRHSEKACADFGESMKTPIGHTANAAMDGWIVGDVPSIAGEISIKHPCFLAKGLT